MKKLILAGLIALTAGAASASNNYAACDSYGQLGKAAAELRDKGDPFHKTLAFYMDTLYSSPNWNENTATQKKIKETNAYSILSDAYYTFKYHNPDEVYDSILLKCLRGY